MAFVFKKFLSFFSYQNNSIAGAAFLIAFLGIVSRLLGLLRDRILASEFGAGDILDVYYASFRVPDLLYSMLILGALSAAFIPVFSDVAHKKSEKKGWELVTKMLIILVGAIAVISLVGVIAMPWIAPLLAPGFTQEKIQLLVDFTRVMFLSPIFLGISAIFGGTLVSRKCFFAYSFAPIVYNLGIIFGALFLCDYFGPIGLAYGVVLGAVLHASVQFFATRRQGYVIQVKSNLIDAHVQKIFRLTLPQMFSMGSGQIHLFVVTLFASTLASGSLAIYNFANNLQSIPLAIFGISFAIAAFPQLSLSISQNKTEEFAQTLAKTARRILYFVVPLSILLIVFRAQVVRVVLGAGEFGWDDTILTFQVLGIMSASLWAQSLIPLFARAFYSMQDTRTPLYITLVSQLTNIACILLLGDKLTLLWLAVAFSVASIVNATLLIVCMYKRLHMLDIKEFIIFSFKITLASIVAVGIAQSGKEAFGLVFREVDTFLKLFSQLMFAGIFALIGYVAMSYFLKIEEFYDFQKRIFIRVFGRSRMVSNPEQKDIDVIS